MRRVALVNVIGGRSLSEIRVHAGDCKLVVARDAAFQPVALDADLGSKLGQRPSAEKISRLLIALEGKTAGKNDTNAVLLDCRRVGNQIGRDGAGIEHAEGESVVRSGLVSEAIAVLAHCNKARLGTVKHEVSPQDLVARLVRKF